jgi:hypothetical protein
VLSRKLTAQPLQWASEYNLEDNTYRALDIISNSFCGEWLELLPISVARAQSPSLQLAELNLPTARGSTVSYIALVLDRTTRLILCLRNSRRQRCRYCPRCRRRGE